MPRRRLASLATPLTGSLICLAFLSTLALATPPTGILSLYGGWIQLSGVSTNLSYTQPTQISLTPLGPAFITNANADLRLVLSNTTVMATSVASVYLKLSDLEAQSLASQVLALSSFSAMFLTFKGSTITLGYHYPNSSQCDSECGQISTSNVLQHVQCRLQCVPPDWTGSRVAVSCGSNLTYFSSIDECIPSSIAGSLVFLQSLTTQRVCPGLTVSGLDDLESLRFCNTVNGTLVIGINTVGADFTSLFDIATITGALVVQNSSMTTFFSFANLETIDSNKVTVMYNSKPYSMVVTGNNLLTDLAFVIDIQQQASLGTVIANNSVLCFQAALAWSQRNDSYLEYSLNQCVNTSCTLYVVGPLCSSICSTCGKLCEPFPIYDLPSLQLYGTSCNIIVGDLYMMNLPLAALRSVIQVYMANVKVIRGDLYFENNPYISAMLFFPSLTSVGNVHYFNNPRLVDARIPTLLTLGNVSVSGCDRLCPARYTRVGPSPDDSGCPNQYLAFYIHIDGNATASQLSFLSYAMYKIAQNVTKNQWMGTTDYSVIETGSGWTNFVVNIYNCDSATHYISLITPFVTNSKLSLFVRQQNDTNFLKSNNVSALFTPIWFPDPDLYNTGNLLLAATVQLDGILLQWTRLFTPSGSNFVQYRPTANRTLSLTDTDVTPFQILPSIFTSSLALEFLVPISYLSPNAFYEFRLGFPFDMYTYYTNSLFAKTYSAGASLVGNVDLQSTNSSITATWSQPEYNIGIVGYLVQVLFNSTNQGSSSLVLFDTIQLSLFDLGLTVSCSSIDATMCIQAYTVYTLYISAIRQTGTDQPTVVTVQTKDAAPDFAISMSVVDFGDDWAIVCPEGLQTTFGLISSIEVEFTVLSSTNDAVSAFNGTQSFSWPNISDCSEMSVDLIPRTSYTLRLRAWTVAGHGPWSNTVDLTTTFLYFATLSAPDIRLLTVVELEVLNWTSGYYVSWLKPQIDPDDFIRFDVLDDGLVGNTSIVYSGPNVFTPLVRIYGAIHVRMITLSGIGNFSVGVVYQGPKAPTVPIAAIVVPIVVCVVLVLVLGAVIGKRRYNEYKIHQEKLADIKRRIPAAVVAVLEQINGGKFNVPRDISPLNLTFLDTLGEGKFGAVMKALLDEQDTTGVHGYLVAVKMAKEDAPQDQTEQMRLEAAMMAQFTHRNVVGLIGQVSEGDLFLLVVQYCEHGSLHSWLPDNGPTAALQTLLNMCTDTAAGMEYLSSLHIVHRDLAARNVLIASDLTCKVSDFGLSRHSDEGAVNTDAKDQVAIRWAAPEAIAERRYTVKSDVWSFGILVYEVFTYGQRPYDSMKNARVVEELRSGYRLPKPSPCPQVVYELMTSTWHADPTSRPDFQSLNSSLRNIAMSFEDKEQTTSMISNKLIERFNATKAAVASSTSSNEEQYSGSHRSNPSLGNSSNQRRGAAGSTGTNSSVAKRQTQWQPLNFKKSRNIASSKSQNDSSKSRIQHANESQHLSSASVASYLAVLGSEDKLITARDQIEPVPPVFHPHRPHHTSEESSVSGGGLAFGTAERTRTKSISSSGDIPYLLRGQTLKEQVGLILNAKKQSFPIDPAFRPHFSDFGDEDDIGEVKSLPSSSQFVRRPSSVSEVSLAQMIRNASEEFEL